MSVSPARWAAFRVLEKVAGAGGFAGDLLHSPLTRGLDERDAALAEELALGVLRRQGQLDLVITAAAERSVDTLDPPVRLALRLGVYQLQHLDRVPARAAVSESVEIVKRARKRSAAALVNAVLRRVAREPLTPMAENCVPPWMLRRWRRHFGEAADTLALATLRPPGTYLRLNARFDAAESIRLLAAEGIDTAATELPLCRRVRSGHPARSRCYRDGRIRIQDLGSQRVAPLLEVGPEHRFLDVCAAPGGKSFQVAEKPAGLSVACDLYHHRLVTMRKLATVPVPLVALDAARALPFGVLFDRILVDVPCSGTGTLSRNPEIKWRLKPADLDDLAGRQRAILASALERLAPGGRLVYSTCSLEPEENEGVADAVVEKPFETRHTRLWLPGRDEGDGFFAAVITRTS